MIGNKINFIILIALLLSIGGFVYAQVPGGFWYPDGTTLRPIVDTWNIGGSEEHTS